MGVKVERIRDSTARTRSIAKNPWRVTFRRPLGPVGRGLLEDQVARAVGPLIPDILSEPGARSSGPRKPLERAGPQVMARRSVTA